MLCGDKIIIFDANGGTVSPLTKGAVQGQKYGELPTPTREGYLFDGWYTEKDGGEKKTSESIYEYDNTSTLYAHWNVDFVKEVKLYGNGSRSKGLVHVQFIQRYSNTTQYSMEYQITGNNEEPNDSNWSYIVDEEYSYVTNRFCYWLNGNGCVTTGLSNGQALYLRFTDKTKNLQYARKISTDGLETYSETVTGQNYVHTDPEGNKATIPVGFRYGTSSSNNTISKGLVIEDENGNEYVWIPVNNVIYDNKTTVALSSNSSKYKPMVRLQQGYASDNYEGVFYDFTSSKSYVLNNRISYRLGTTGYREPSLSTGSSNNLNWKFTEGTEQDAANYSKLAVLKNTGITIDSPSAMGEYMNNKFTEMVKSVNTYKGFYVGRYETSTWSAGQTNNTATTGEIVKSISRATAMSTVSWYDMYIKSDSNYESNPYFNSSSVRSAMIWGCQYDAMLNHIMNGEDKSKVTSVIGNHSGGVWHTGSYPTDIMSNIFDLSSNLKEWTQESMGPGHRIMRGGYYGKSDTVTAGARDSALSAAMPTNAYNDRGSRLTLYLK